MAFLSVLPLTAKSQLNGIKGTVVSRIGRAPVQGAKVTLKADKERIVVTSQKGEFEITDIPLGTYQMIVEAADFQTLNLSVKVENYLKDLNFITLVSEFVVEKADEFSLSEFDTESASDVQSMPVLLSASKDVFENIAGYKFGEVRFRNRGYDNSTSAVYLNGVYMNDALNGYTPWSLWGGLNEATRDQEVTTGVALSDYGLGGFNGTTNINARASKMRKGYRFSAVNASGQYRLRLMATYASGENDKGWSYAFSASTRQGGNDWVNGLYYNAFSYFASVEKRFAQDHRLAFTFFGSPTERGVQGASTQEVYDLVESNYYNPNWGFQGDKKRNARVRNSHEPVAMINYYFEPEKGLNLNASVAYRFGSNGYSALDWYDAPDPRPDYYRNLPSYYPNDPYKAEYIKEGWLTDWKIRQIDWDRMYQINYENRQGQSGKARSQYVIEERHIDQKDLLAKIQGSLRINDFHKLTFGADMRWNITDHYKKMKDLLGGQYWVDIDKFAERDYGNHDIIQNDLNFPDRIIGKGDKYGYNYKGHVQNYKVWIAENYSGKRFDAYAAVDGGFSMFWREGMYLKGLFPTNSYGNSEKLKFWTYTAKAGLNYKIDGHNNVYANVAIVQAAPYFQEAFISPRTRNSVVPNLTTEKTMTADLNYSVRLPYLKMRVTGFYTQIKDQTKLISFYDDISRAYTNFAMSGIDQINTGVEFGLSAPIYKGLTLNGAFNYGYYIYSSNPNVTQTLDNSDAILLQNEKVYWKNFKIAGTPQTAANIGLNYRSQNYLFLGVDLNYYDAMYLDMNPLYRTDFAHKGLTYEQSQDLARQERFNNTFTLSANVGKSWQINRKYNLGFSLEVKNLLNNRDIKTGGYEQMRLKVNEDASGNAMSYGRFDSKYFYMFGTTYYFNLYFRF